MCLFLASTIFRRGSISYCFHRQSLHACFISLHPAVDFFSSILMFIYALYAWDCAPWDLVRRASLVWLEFCYSSIIIIQHIVM